eukprot:187107-Amorphochlora_amoeboformis.AAC.2
MVGSRKIWERETVSAPGRPSRNRRHVLRNGHVALGVTLRLVLGVTHGCITNWKFHARLDTEISRLFPSRANLGQK